MKAAALGLSLILLVLPFAAQADENLVAKREACQQQARVQISPKGKIGLDGFRRIVERRANHVKDCMSRPFMARKDQPLAPSRALNASDVHQERATGSVRRKASAVVKSAAQPKLQARSVKRSKSQTSGVRKRGRLSRMRG